MNIRPVKASELEILLSIVRQTFIDTYEHLNDPTDFQAYLENNFTLEKLSEDFKPSSDSLSLQGHDFHSEVRISTEGDNRLLKGAYFYFVEDEKICGYFKINLDKSPLESVDPLIYKSDFDYKKLKGIEIERIYVIREMKGHGIGRIMIEKTIEIAKNNRFDYVWLGVWAENAAAISFYEKMGFTVFGEHIFMMGNDAQKDFLMLIEIL